MSIPIPEDGGGVGVSSIDAIIAIMEFSGIPHRVTSTYRSTSTTYHGTRNAVDFAGPAPGWDSPELDAIATFWAGLGPYLLELIYSGPASQFWNDGERVSPYAAADHHDHVHVAATLDGLLSSGGIIIDPGGGGDPGDWPGGPGAEYFSTGWRSIPIIDAVSRRLFQTYTGSATALYPVDILHSSPNAGAEQAAYEAAAADVGAATPVETYFGGAAHPQQEFVNSIGLHDFGGGDPEGAAITVYTVATATGVLDVSRIYQASDEDRQAWVEEAVIADSNATYPDLAEWDDKVWEYIFFDTPVVTSATLTFTVHGSFWADGNPPWDYVPDPFVVNIYRLDSAGTFVYADDDFNSHMTPTPMTPGQIAGGVLTWVLTPPAPVNLEFPYTRPTTQVTVSVDVGLRNGQNIIPLGIATSRDVAGAGLSLWVDHPAIRPYSRHNESNLTSIGFDVRARFGLYRIRARRDGGGFCEVPENPGRPPEVLTIGATQARRPRFYRPDPL